MAIRTAGRCNAMFFVLSACLGSLCSAAGADEAVSEAPLLFDIGADPTRRPTAALMINGRGPFFFIVDTGATRTAVSRELADRLGLATHRQVEIDGVTGSAAVDMVTLSSVEAGGLRLSNIEAPIVSSNMLGRSDGLLGMDAVAGLRVAFDFATRRVEIGASGEPLPGEGETTPAEAHILSSGLAEVTVRFRGASVGALIDTGSDTTLGNAALRAAIPDGAWRPVEAHGGVEVVGASDAVVLGELGVLRSFRFGQSLVVQAPIVTAEFPIFDARGVADEPALVLGMDLLEQVQRLVIDYGAGEVLLTGAPTAMTFDVHQVEGGDSGFCTVDSWTTGAGC